MNRPNAAGTAALPGQSNLQSRIDYDMVMAVSGRFRKMKRAPTTALCVFFLLIASNILIPADSSKVYYVCNCNDNCACSYVSTQPGKCRCGMELAPMHLLTIEKSIGIFCRCGKNCTCERSREHPGKCGCGKPVKSVSLKGKYICACGPTCNCGTISDKPGTCRCGRRLQQVS